MQYITGPVMYPVGFFDARFAEKYGICAALLFNGIAHEIISAERLSKKERENNFLSTMEEDGRLWVRFHEHFLTNSTLFDAEEMKTAFERMKNGGVILVRPGVTEGYYWVALGEEA